jgi:membrane protein
MLLRWGNAIDPGVTNLLYYSVQNFNVITDHYYVPLVGFLFVSLMIFITLGSLVSGLHKMWSVEVTGWRSYVARLGRIAVFIVVLQAYLVAVLMLADTFTAVAAYTTWSGFTYIRFVTAFILTMLLLTFAYGTLALRAPSFRARFVGAAVAGMMLLFSRELVTLHFTTAPVQSLFGAAGLLITLLVWVYVAASIILYGAAFAKVYDDERLTTG